MNLGQNFLRAILMLNLLTAFIYAQNQNAPDLRQKLKLKHIFQTGDQRLQYSVFTPTGDFVLTSGKDNNIRIWSVETGELVTKFAPCNGSGYGGRSFSTSGNLLGVGCYNNGTSELWNIKTSEKLKTFQTTPFGERLTSVLLSPNGTRAVTQSAYGEITELWEAKTGTRLAELSAFSTKAGLDSDGIVFSPDSQTIAISFSNSSNSFNSDVYLWNAQTARLTARLIDAATDSESSQNVKATHYGITRELLFTPDSLTVVTGSYDKIAKAWDVETGRLKHIFRGHKDKITSLAVSPDGRILATGSADKQIKLWDMKSGELLWTSPSLKREVWKMFLNPDGKQLITMTNNEIYLWETTTGKLIGKMPNTFWQIFVSPDWHYIVMPGKKKGTVELHEFSSK